MLQGARTIVVAQRDKARKIYKKYEAFLPIGFFFLGFLYDSLTLTRIDRIGDNIVLLAYTVLAGFIILLIGLIQTRQVTNTKILRYQDWYFNGLHFMLGNLFSAYVIFYFKSATISKSMIFVILLLGLLVANEFFKHRLENIIFLCTLYFFSTFAFLTFFLPVMTRRLSSAMFFSSGAISFIITSAIVTMIYRKVFRKEPRKIWGSATPLLSVLGVMVFLYLSNWIPPVPLALKDSGIYHHVHRDAAVFQVKFYRPHWFQFWVHSDKKFAYSPGDTVFCYTSIFAPGKLRTHVYHHWQRFDSGKDDFVTTDRLDYLITGGRDGGFRGYTYKRHVQPGNWRVDVETERGQVLGRIDFRVDDSGRARDRLIVREK